MLFVLLTAALTAEPMCDICNGGLLKNGTHAGWTDPSSPYTCQDVQDSARDAQPGACSESQSLWGQTCCELNPASLANHSDANTNESSVVAGLHSCFDHGVIADEGTNARLPDPACVTAWATLCTRDEVLGEWMQEKVRSRGFRLCNQVPAWAKGESLPGGMLETWLTDTTLEMLGYAASLLGVSWFAPFLTATFTDACVTTFEVNIGFQWLWAGWITANGANLSSPWPSEAALYSPLHMRFLEQKVDGAVLCTLSADDLAQLGVPLGAAKHWRAGMNTYLYTEVTLTLT